MVLKKTDAQHVITAMEAMFRTHGLPVSVQSDNGPPFASKEFEVFLEYLGKEHKKVVIESSEGYTEDAQCSTLEKTCQNRKARH